MGGGALAARGDDRRLPTIVLERVVRRVAGGGEARSHLRGHVPLAFGHQCGVRLRTRVTGVEGSSPRSDDVGRQRDRVRCGALALRRRRCERGTRRRRGLTRSSTARLGAPRYDLASAGLLVPRHHCSCRQAGVADRRRRPRTTMATIATRTTMAAGLVGSARRWLRSHAIRCDVIVAAPALLLCTASVATAEVVNLVRVSRSRCSSTSASHPAPVDVLGSPPPGGPIPRARGGRDDGIGLAPSRRSCGKRGFPGHPSSPTRGHVHRHAILGDGRVVTELPRLRRTPPCAEPAAPSAVPPADSRNACGARGLVPHIVGRHQESAAPRVPCLPAIHQTRSAPGLETRCPRGRRDTSTGDTDRSTLVSILRLRASASQVPAPTYCASTQLLPQAHHRATPAAAAAPN